MKLLVANRGEVAIRVMRAAAELEIPSVGVFSGDDARSLHVRRADCAVALDGDGPAAYLDADRLIAIAREHACDAVHPGYGFLSESAAFARQCEVAGMRFVGPTPQTLDALGDKVSARALAARCSVPVLPATSGPTDLAAASEFFASLAAGASVMVKAIAGGGGRGLRPVTAVRDLDAALRRCTSEAEKAFGRGDVYVEQRLPGARHIEVQIVGDGSGDVIHLAERDCSVQRRHQKLIEVAPAPGLDGATRSAIAEAALAMASRLSYRSLGTFEFLLADDRRAFFFIEANPRLQVEHTVTEEVTGVDLVATQLRIGRGETLGALGLSRSARPTGFAIQLRIDTETIESDGSVHPQGGTIAAFDMPSGRGVRTETAGYVGYTPSPRFDSLLTKLIVHSPSNDFADAALKCGRALRELRVEGITTNRDLLAAVLRHPSFRRYEIETGFLDRHLAELIDAAGEVPPLFFPTTDPAGARSATGGGAAGLAGTRVDTADPLAVLRHGKSEDPAGPPAPLAAAASADTIAAPIQGTVVSVEVEEGGLVVPGQELVVLEAMKMEHVVAARCTGRVGSIAVKPGDTIFEGHPLLHLEDTDASGSNENAAEPVDPERIRADLEEVIERHRVGLDAARPQAVARRLETGHRTTRENIADLCDEGSFVEYGPLVLAAQHRRRSREELIEKTPADGMVAGIGSINGELFDEAAAQCAVLSYDYTVLAGTQGLQNHRKKDRIFEIAAKRALPVVLFAEGGGGRPGDTDGYGVTGLDCLAFQLFAELNGQVPMVGITTGRCFAGNAVLLGCCDVIIATGGSNIGLGGPAMVEGGGLGVFRPEEIGPMQVQVANGVVDVAVADEAAAVVTAKRYLSYFQGAIDTWEAPDQRHLRHVIPENRLRIYDVRRVVELLADAGSVLELREQFGAGMVTALARVEGHPLGIVANNPAHLAGAIDSDGADKATRFVQLCDAFDIPLLFLCDTPGIMVGPEAEKTALVRHAARMFVTGAGISVPFATIVLRKGYGLGAQAMAGGSFKAPTFTVAWPTGEFGGMGLEGAVKLGFRNELAAVEDPGERNRLFQDMVARMYQVGKAVNVAAHFEIDEVIDPADSRKWIRNMLTERPKTDRPGRKRIDTW